MKFKLDATVVSFRFANVGCSQWSCDLQNVVSVFIKLVARIIGYKKVGITTALEAGTEASIRLEHDCVNANHSNKVTTDITLAKVTGANILLPLSTGLLPY